MFKPQGTPISADVYFNIYEGCNQGCDFCKFNETISIPTPNTLDASLYKDKTVLVSYSTEPLPFKDNSYTINCIKQLHNNNAKIIFLSRRPTKTLEILNQFNAQDLIGVSISETSNPNFNDIFAIKKLAQKCNQKNLKMWISLEPVCTKEFADNIIHLFEDQVEYIRVGKLDNAKDDIQEEWQDIREHIQSNHSQKNILLKQ